MIDARPGDVIHIKEGNYQLTSGLALDVDDDAVAVAVLEPAGTLHNLVDHRNNIGGLERNR